jgi:hypothetical protein
MTAGKLIKELQKYPPRTLVTADWDALERADCTYSEVTKVTDETVPWQDADGGTTLPSGNERIRHVVVLS